MRLHVLTSDRYIYAIRPFAWLLKKYWPDHPEVVVGGFSMPPFAMPEKFVFVSIGRFENYPVNKWSDGVIRFLDLVGDEVVCLFLEDMWPIRPIDGDVVKMAYDYMNQFHYVARLDLTGDRLYANGGNVSKYGELGHVGLIWSDPDSQYHLSTMPAFWRAAHLKRVLVPGETPWQTELQGTPRLSRLRNEMIVLGTDAVPIKVTLAFRGGDTGKLLLNEIAPGDVHEMREAGILKELE